MKNWFFANENTKTKRERKVLTSFTLLLTTGFTLFLKAMFFYFSLSQQRPKIKGFTGYYSFIRFPND